MKIKSKQTNNRQFHKNVTNNRENPLCYGDTVRITNQYRINEYGAVGVVTSVGRKMVEMRNSDTGKLRSRAWWNLERVETPKRHKSKGAPE